MRILNEILKKTEERAREVRTGKVLAYREGRALIESEGYQIWARCGSPVAVGARVTYARTKEGYEVLSTTTTLSKMTKTVRV
jgi:hypothetical protein